MVSAETRQAALARADRALREFVVLGITTNIALLRQLVQHPDVRAGRLDTGLLDRIIPELSAAAPDEVPVAVEAVAALHASGAGTPADRRSHVGSDPWGAGGWRP